jgi:hypothetical protein
MRGNIPNWDEFSNRSRGYVREPPSTDRKSCLHRFPRRRCLRRSIRIAGGRSEEAKVASIQCNQGDAQRGRAPSSAGGNPWHVHPPRQLDGAHFTVPLADDRPAGGASRRRHDRCRHGPPIGKRADHVAYRLDPGPTGQQHRRRRSESSVAVQGRRGIRAGLVHLDVLLVRGSDRRDHGLRRCRRVCAHCHSRRAVQRQHEAHCSAFDHDYRRRGTRNRAVREQLEELDDGAFGHVRGVRRHD